MTDLLERLRSREAAATKGPWTLCQHLKSVSDDAACLCGYRGVIYAQGEHSDDYAVCQPGHEPAPVGQEGSEPPRFARETEIANAALIVAMRNALPQLLDEHDHQAATIARLKALLVEADWIIEAGVSVRISDEELRTAHREDRSFIKRTRRFLASARTALKED